MTQPSDVLQEAYGWLGARENPDGSNKVLQPQWRDGRGVTDFWPMVGAWCACWVSRVFWNAGLPLGPYSAHDHAGFLWCSDGADWFRAQGRTLPSSEAEPGDVLMFEWGSTAGGYDHVGICVANLGNCLITIEGNTSNKVMEHTRYFSEIPEACRPAWSTPLPRPKKVPPMIDSLTYPDDHPTHWSDGVEFIAGGNLVLWRVEDVPGGHAPNNWSDWAPITPTSGAAAPGPVDSVTARINGQGCLEILAWHSEDLNHKFRAWEMTPGGRWDGWIDVP